MAKVYLDPRAKSTGQTIDGDYDALEVICPISHRRDNQSPLRQRMLKAGVHTSDPCIETAEEVYDAVRGPQLDCTACSLQMDCAVRVGEAVFPMCLEHWSGVVTYAVSRTPVIVDLSNGRAHVPCFRGKMIPERGHHFIVGNRQSSYLLSARWMLGLLRHNLVIKGRVNVGVPC